MGGPVVQYSYRAHLENTSVLDESPGVTAQMYFFCHTKFKCTFFSTAERVGILGDYIPLEGTEEDGEIEARLEYLQFELEEVRRIQKHGKYSGRYKGSTTPTEVKETCQKCAYQHGESSTCPAEGRDCNVCGKKGHFSRSKLCRNSKTNTTSTRRVTEKEKEMESEESSSEEEVVQRIGKVQQWPQVRRKARSHTIYHVARVTEKRDKRNKMGQHQDGGHRREIVL